ncbi:uncharacterized protein [Cicer arietinum]|uniref:Transcription factor bHLH117 n=1 Tax=Cicer arietinum TaxID=3827 RepID=A0A1S2XCX4_CICAR|nr:transcription factor bHLH117 [Cicer arietinum]
MDPNMNSMFSNETTTSSSIDPMFSTFSLQSLLTFNPSFFTDATFHTLTDYPPLPNLPQSTTDQTPNLNNNNNNNKKHLLVIPKTEHPMNINHLPSIEQLLPLQQNQQQPFHFFPNNYYQPFQSFHSLPQLRSPEPTFSDTKRPRLNLTPETTPPPSSVRGKSPLIPQSNLARQRRQKLSEKTRCLQKLMPWDKKMDQATLLEEAYKYVKFLQAQFSVLQSMPSHTTNNYGSGAGAGGGGVFADLEKLNRNQVLQVLVNSPVAQTKLYSQGHCVFSMEQFSLLRKLSENRQQQQNMSEHDSSRTFFH